MIAFLGWHRRTLTRGGAAAAVVIGTLAVAAGVRWGALLVMYFVASVFLSAWRHADKDARTADVVAKTGPRDAWQVMANGVAYVTLALAAEWWKSDVVAGAALGALTASMADTSATEIGSAVGGRPRSILSWQPVAPGTSGGVTALGTLAMFSGSALLGLIALLLGFGGGSVWAAIIGGNAGALADSLLGSTLQERRICPSCGTLTERRRHGCQPAGVGTDVISGIRGFDNDWVNLTSTVIGAAAATISRGGI